MLEYSCIENRLKECILELSNKEKKYTEQKEDLLDRLDRILEWIKACDTKSSVLLAGIGIAATVLTSDRFLSKENQLFKYFTKNLRFINFNFLYLAFFAFFFLLILTGVILFVIELTPSLISRRNKNKETNSLYFFGTIHKKKLDEFKDEYKKKKNKSDIDDLLNQVYFNAKICQHKYMCATWGIRTTTIGILGVFIMFILGIIIVK